MDVSGCAQYDAITACLNGLDLLDSRASRSRVLSKPNLVLDLDETLIYGMAVDSLERHSFYTSHANYLTQFSFSGGVYVILYRPNLFEFLLEISEFFELHVYTNSSERYCNEIVRSISSKLGYNPFKSIKFRTNFSYPYKHLTEIGLSQSDTVVIDDIIGVWPGDTNNVIEIKKFEGADDEELVKICEFLMDLHEEHNKRTHFSEVVFFKNIAHMARDAISDLDMFDAAMSTDQ